MSPLFAWVEADRLALLSKLEREAWDGWKTVTPLPVVEELDVTVEFDDLKEVLAERRRHARNMYNARVRERSAA